jgi:hypothetical protein
MMKTQTYSLTDLTPPGWRSTYMMRPEIAMLAQSLNQYGWISPLIVKSDTLEIIDGYHRWLVVKTDKGMAKKLGRDIPCVTVKCDQAQAMMMHLQLNRGRGLVLGEGTSFIIRELLKSKRYGKAAIMHSLSMSSDEFDLMVDATLIKHLKIPTHTYSKAWVPVEAPASIGDVAATIERPPNADR